MISYGCVGVALLAMGLVFSGFAIFKKDSEIAKVWLAGPTTMAVGECEIDSSDLEYKRLGMVLCGKVLIDCDTMARRAMMEYEESSDDPNFDNINISLGWPAAVSTLIFDAYAFRSTRLHTTAQHTHWRRG